MTRPVGTIFVIEPLFELTPAALAYLKQANSDSKRAQQGDPHHPPRLRV